jgi:hypothetical protein
MTVRLTGPLAAAALVLLGGCGGTDLGGAPDVRGIDLETARVQLEAAGWEPSAKSDALFGVIVESNFAVCDQNTPVGKIVPLEVSKRC